MDEIDASKGKQKRPNCLLLLIPLRMPYVLSFRHIMLDQAGQIASPARCRWTATDSAK